MGNSKHELGQPNMQEDKRGIYSGDEDKPPDDGSFPDTLQPSDQGQHMGLEEISNTDDVMFGDGSDMDGDDDNSFDGSMADDAVDDMALQD